jgi:hypothetical protein
VSDKVLPSALVAFEGILVLVLVLLLVLVLVLELNLIRNKVD